MENGLLGNKDSPKKRKLDPIVLEIDEDELIGAGGGAYDDSKGKKQAASPSKNRKSRRDVLNIREDLDNSIDEI